MSEIQTQYEPRDQQLPPMIHDMLTIAAVRLDLSGKVLECNRGFGYLLGVEPEAVIDTNVSSKLVNPSFDDLQLTRVRPTEVAYRGIMTIGDTQQNNRSLHGVIYRHSRELRLIAEHDLINLERLNATVIELNNELAQTHRDLVKSNQAFKRQEAEITKLMLTDSLTGIPNRRHFMQVLDREYKRAGRAGTPISLAICDIDNFKAVNDIFGHNIGDDVLCRVATAIAENIRQTDFTARWGGEEFVILFVDSNCDDASLVAERVRQAIEAIYFENLNGNVTISIGLTQGLHDEPYEEAIKRADKGLYESKKRGRNQVTTLCPKESEK